MTKSSDLRDKFAIFKDDVDTLHRRMVVLNAELLTELNKGGPKEDGPALADIGYLLRESHNVTKEMSIDCKAKAHFLGKILFVSLTLLHLQGADGDIAYRGKYGAAYPKAGKKAILPKRGTEAYHKLLAWLEVPRNMIETGILAPHYVRLTEHLNAEILKGNEPPKDLGIQMAPYDSCTYRKRTKK